MSVLNSETAARIRPFHVIENVTHYPAGAAFYAAFIGEQDPAVLLRGVAICGTAVDTLLTFAVKTNISINDPDMRSPPVNVVHI